MAKNNFDENVEAKLYVCVDHKRYKQDGEQLANHLGVEQIKRIDEVSTNDLVLLYNKDGLSLVGGKLSLQADFNNMLPRVKEGMWQHELIARAAKIKEGDLNQRAIYPRVDFVVYFLILIKACNRDLTGITVSMLLATWLLYQHRECQAYCVIVLRH